MDWSSFLIQVASRSAGAAVGVAAVPAGPVASAAAGSFTFSAAERLLGEFHQAQASQLQRIEDLNRELQGRLVGLEASMRTLLSAPLGRARLHIEHAHRSPGDLTTELTFARTALFEAWSLAEDHPTRRVVVAVQLGVVFALLGDAGAARTWLVRSHTDASEAVRTQTNALQQVIETQVREAKRVLPSDRSKMLWATLVDLDGGSPIEKMKRRTDQYDKYAAYRLEEIRGPLANQAQAIAGLQWDVDVVREACLRLGANYSDVPKQLVIVNASADDVVQIRVVS